MFKQNPFGAIIPIIAVLLILSFLLMIRKQSMLLDLHDTMETVEGLRKTIELAVIKTVQMKCWSMCIRMG